MGFTIFTIISMVWSLRLSFSNYDLATNRGTPVGLANYQLLLEDPKVLTSLYNTFFYTLLAVPLEMIIALALASLLATVRRGSGVFRTIFFLPKMTPVVATASVFLLLLNGNTGAINNFLGLFGIPGPQWLTDPDWVKPAIVIMSLWTVAGSMVILLAALQNVPRELYEAAETDGASRLRQFFSITVPLISPTLFFLTIVNTIAALQVFDQSYLLFFRDGTSSAPDAALFYGVYLFQQAFRQFNFGLAAAMAWLLFVIILGITAIQLKVGNRLVHYEGGDAMSLAAAPTQVTNPAPAVYAGPQAVQSKASQRWQLPGQIIRWVLLILVSVAFLYPFAWLLSASLKPRGEVFDNRLIPVTFSPQNYVEVWEQLPLLAWVGNSILIAVLSATLMTLSSSLVAFGFAYFRFPFKRLLFGLVLASMMLPGAVTLVPNYLIWKWLGWLGTTVPLWGAALFGVRVLHLPDAAVLPVAASGPVRGGPGGRLLVLRAVAADRVPVGAAVVDHRVHLRVPGVVAELPGAADLPQLRQPGTVHGAAGDLVRDDAVQPDGRRPGRLPVRDGRVAAGHPADDDHLRLRPALLHRGCGHGRPQGLTARDSRRRADVRGCRGAPARARWPRTAP